MYLLISNSNDPHFNLATEEFLLKNSANDIIFLYQNKACIVVGKHQNAIAEINYRFVTENNIPVIRRISGGGTVYHDEGNINFTFLQNGETGKLVNFKAFIAPVAEFLNQLGVPAEIGSRNDILINGLKVSGNAEHIYKNRTLHHGTLLFSSTLTDLRNALHVTEGKYTDRSVKSVRSKVTNIRENLTMDLSADQFFKELTQFLQSYYNAMPFELSSEEIAKIQELAETKYKDWNWNFGYSPDYTFKNCINIGKVLISIELHVKKGKIKETCLEGNIGTGLLKELNNILPGKQHSFSEIKSIAGINREITEENPEFLWSFF